MTKQEITQDLDEMMNAEAWNYILVVAGAITAVVAFRNIYIYGKKIAESKNLLENS